MNMHQSAMIASNRGGGGDMSDTRKPALACNPIRGRRPVLQNCTLAELAVDPGYQRSTESGASQAFIRDVARDWDWSLCQPLVVAQRPGAGLFVVDGQHRLAAARLRGDILDLPCVITPYPDAAAEAAAFVKLNQKRRPLRALDLFKASLGAGNAEAVAVMALIDAAGLRLSPHDNYKWWKPGELSNVAGIQACHRQYGDALTGRALRLLASAFDGQVLRYGGTLFAGLWPVMAELGDACDDDLLGEVLAGASQTDWFKDIAAIAADQAIHHRRAAAIAIRSAYDEALAECLGEEA